MAEFVHCQPLKKGADRAVCEQCYSEAHPQLLIETDVGEQARGGPQAQMPQGLAAAPQVAALHELRQLLPLDGRPVPLNPECLADLRQRCVLRIHLGRLLLRTRLPESATCHSCKIPTTARRSLYCTRLTLIVTRSVRFLPSVGVPQADGFSVGFIDLGLRIVLTILLRDGRTRIDRMHRIREKSASVVDPVSPVHPCSQDDYKLSTLNVRIVSGNLFLKRREWKLTVRRTHDHKLPLREVPR